MSALLSFMTSLQKCAVITSHYIALHLLLVCLSIALVGKISTKNGQGPTN
jgi:hypothetical protein